MGWAANVAKWHPTLRQGSRPDQPPVASSPCTAWPRSIAQTTAGWEGTQGASCAAYVKTLQDRRQPCSKMLQLHPLAGRHKGG